MKVAGWVVLMVAQKVMKLVELLVSTWAAQLDRMKADNLVGC